MSTDHLRLLLVEDNPVDARLTRAALDLDAADIAIDLTHADTLAGARARLEDGGFDAILLDLHLPDGSCIDCVRAMRENAPHTAIVIVTSMRDEAFVLSAMSASVQDYVVKDELLAGGLIRDIRRAIGRQACLNRLREDAERARQHALHDALTGLPNRELLTECFEMAHARAERDGHSLAIAWFDLDNFKRLNDTHGHATGDSALQAVAEALRGSCRLGDMIARYGGDEFVALLAPIGDANAVEAVVARMMTGVETAAERVLPEPLRVSAGYACWPAHGSSLTELLRKADAAMYRAKADRDGRPRMAEAGTMPRDEADAATLMPADRHAHATRSHRGAQL